MEVFGAAGSHAEETFSCSKTGKKKGRGRVIGWNKRICLF